MIRLWQGCRSLFLTACLLSSVMFAATAGAHWTDHARRFTGESLAVRENAIAELRKDPRLVSQLKKALGTSDHFLALDVISVLGLRTLFQQLLFFSERDRTGYSYHVLNSLLKPGEEAEIGAIYLVRLDRPNVSTASKMAILDSLARMDVSVGSERLERMLRHEEPEVRSSALGYLRTELLLRGKLTDRDLVRIGVQDPAFQNRLQAVFLVSEMMAKISGDGSSADDRVYWMAVLESCVKDPVSQVRTFCNELRDGKRGKT